MTYRLKTEALSVGYHHNPLIENISVEIAPGEIVTLIGPNGAGKSTILKSVAKQLVPIDGCVYIGKDSMDNMSYATLSRRMAVVLTERISPELMRASEVVAMGRYPYTNRLGVLKEEDEAAVEQAMDLVGISELSEQAYETLSDGQKQRVLLARAICQEPEILVLDEPTSFLDIHYKVQLLSVLRKMAADKKITILMTLHEIDLAQKVSDKILCVREKEIMGFGTPEEIFKRETIQRLYGISEDVYNLSFGSVEMPREDKEPSVFVISNGGSGIPVYRRLQREGKGFYAGILSQTDVDYQVAKALAAEVVLSPPFEPVSEESLQRAKKLVDECREVILCDLYMGSGNGKMTRLVDYARAQGKLRKRKR